MKTYLILAALLLASGGMAQNFAVRFYGAGNPEGLPQYWPAQVQPIGTNTATTPPAVLMTAAQLANCRATNQTAYAAWESNKVYVANAALDANVARLLVLYDAIPAARTQYATGRTLLATIDASLASGTNTTAQLIARIRQMVTVQRETILYLDGLTEFIQRLGPVLKSMYRPEDDTTP